MDLVIWIFSAIGYLLGAMIIEQWIAVGLFFLIYWITQYHYYKTVTSRRNEYGTVILPKTGFRGVTQSIKEEFLYGCLMWILGLTAIYLFLVPAMLAEWENRIPT